MVYWLWRLEERGGWHDAAFAAAAALLALYAIPSNLYFLLSAAVFYAAMAAGRALRGPGQGPTAPWLRHLADRYLLATLAITAGIAGATMLYLPMWDAVVHNPTVQAAGRFHGQTLTVLLPRMLTSLVSGRHVLTGLLVVGAVLLAIRRPAAQDLLNPRYLMCLSMLVLPFVCSWIRGDQPPCRIFVPGAVPLALLAAVSAQVLGERLAMRPQVGWSALGLAALYGYLVMGAGLREMDRRLQDDILQGHTTPDSLHAYYQAYYEPRRTIDDLAARCRVAPDRSSCTGRPTTWPRASTRCGTGSPTWAWTIPAR